MGQFEELWSYCRETFRIVLDRPFLFVPRLLFAGIQLFAILAIIGMGSFFSRVPMTSNMLGLPGALIVLIIAGILGRLVLAAGELNLFRKAASGYAVGAGDFWDGVRRFAGRVLLGEVMLGLVLIVVGIPALILIPLGGLRIIGFIAVVVLSFTVTAFLSLWKAAVAFKDIGVIDAFMDSYDFVRDYFWPMVLVVFVRGLFNGNRQNNNGNRGSGFNINFNLPGIHFGPFNWRYMGWDIAAMIPFVVIFMVISIIILIYLDQLTFVIYSRREGIEAEH